MAPETTAYRAVNFGTPLRVEPSRRAGRFHRANEFPTQYACLHPLGPLAEMIRGQDLSEPDARELRMRTWALRVDVESFVEIGFSEASRLGIDPVDLVSDVHGPCQQLADRQRGSGVRGLIVPSASLPGTRNIVIFGERVAAGYLDTTVDDALDIPASMTADPGQPPLSLYPLVRRKGQPHLELAAWQSNAPFAFVEPDWSYPSHRIDVPLTAAGE